MVSASQLIPALSESNLLLAKAAYELRGVNSNLADQIAEAIERNAVLIEDALRS